MKKIVLLTGFEPFNQESINPSWEAVRALEGWSEAGFRVVVRQLPCLFGVAKLAMKNLIEELQPSVVIAVGQAGGRSDLSVERIAINVDDAPIADNNQRQLIDQPVVPGGPAAYFATLPIKAIVHALRDAGLPASVSQSAGTFVCNHVFYGLMRALATKRELRHTRGGFVHVPWLPEQGTPNMALDDIVRGLRVALRCALLVQEDPALGAGATN